MFLTHRSVLSIVTGIIGVIVACGAWPGVARANDTDYLPPTDYYSSAAGLTGANLQTQLRTIISSGLVARSYGDLRYADAILDADPNNPNNVISVYDRSSVKAAWDGSTWTREHLWPVSLIGASDPSNTNKDMRTDEFLVRPSAVNGSRSNLSYGTVTSSGTYGKSGNFYYPGDADSGDCARAMFYGVTRYANYNGHALSLVNGSAASGSYSMGDLNSMLHWNYTDVPDAFERRRNQAVYSSTLNPTYYQGNRNPFIDHPEWVWSVFVNQANDTSLTTSTHAVDLGRIITGQAFGSQVMTINKTGAAGTYYQVSTDGSATSSVTGSYNAFAMDVAGSKSVALGLNASTSTAGLKSGTVTVHNLDITTGAGAGMGALDPNDVVNVTGTVVDHAAPSLTAQGQATSLTLDFGSVSLGSGMHALPLDVYNLFRTAGYTAGLDLDSFSFTGDSSAISSTLATFSNLDAGNYADFAVLLNTATTGTFSGVYTLNCSDENIPGAQAFAPMTVTIRADVTAATDTPGVPAPPVLAGVAGLAAVWAFGRIVRRVA